MTKNWELIEKQVSADKIDYKLGNNKIIEKIKNKFKVVSKVTILNETFRVSWNVVTLKTTQQVNKVMIQ